MRKKWFLAAMALFLFFGTFTPALALETAPSVAAAVTPSTTQALPENVDHLFTDSAIAKAVKLTAEAAGITNPDLVEPGERYSFHLPDGTVEDAEVLAVDLIRGRHDCLWRATLRLQEAKLARDRANKPYYRIGTAYVSPGPIVYRETTETESPISVWPAILVILLALATLFGLFGFHFFKRKKLDADRLPPVIPGGLSRDLPTALAAARFQASGSEFTPRAVTAGYFRRIGGGKILGLVPDPRNYFEAEMGFAGGVVEKANIVEGDIYYRFSDAKGRHMFSRFSCGNYATKLTIPAGWEFVEGSSYRPSPEILAQQEISFRPMIGELDVMNPAFGATEVGEETVEFVSGQPGEFVYPVGSEAITPALMPKGDMIVRAGSADPFRIVNFSAVEMAELRGIQHGLVVEPDMTMMAENPLTEMEFDLDMVCPRCGDRLFCKEQAYCTFCGKSLLTIDPFSTQEKATSGGLPETKKKVRPMEVPGGIRVLVDGPESIPDPAPVESKKTTHIIIKGADGVVTNEVIINQDLGTEPVTQIRLPGGPTINFPRGGKDISGE